MHSRSAPRGSLKSPWRRAARASAELRRTRKLVKLLFARAALRRTQSPRVAAAPRSTPLHPGLLPRIYLLDPGAVNRVKQAAWVDGHAVGGRARPCPAGPRPAQLYPTRPHAGRGVPCRAMAGHLILARPHADRRDPRAARAPQLITAGPRPGRHVPLTTPTGAARAGGKRPPITSRPARPSRSRARHHVRGAVTVEVTAHSVKRSRPTGPGPAREPRPGCAPTRRVAGPPGRPENAIPST